MGVGTLSYLLSGPGSSGSGRDTLPESHSMPHAAQKKIQKQTLSGNVMSQPGVSRYRICSAYLRDVCIQESCKLCHDRQGHALQSQSSSKTAWLWVAPSSGAHAGHRCRNKQSQLGGFVAAHFLSRACVGSPNPKSMPQQHCSCKNSVTTAENLTVVSKLVSPKYLKSSEYCRTSSWNFPFANALSNNARNKPCASARCSAILALDVLMCSTYETINDVVT